MRDPSDLVPDVQEQRVGGHLDDPDQWRCLGGQEHRSIILKIAALDAALSYLV